MDPSAFHQAATRRVVMPEGIWETLMGNSSGWVSRHRYGAEEKIVTGFEGRKSRVSSIQDWRFDRPP